MSEPSTAHRKCGNCGSENVVEWDEVSFDGDELGQRLCLDCGAGVVLQKPHKQPFGDSDDISEAIW